MSLRDLRAKVEEQVVYNDGKIIQVEVLLNSDSLGNIRKPFLTVIESVESISQPGNEKSSCNYFERKE